MLGHAWNLGQPHCINNMKKKREESGREKRERERVGREVRKEGKKRRGKVVRNIKHERGKERQGERGGAVVECQREK